MVPPGGAGKRTMVVILVKAVAITALSIVASFSIMLAMGVEISGNALWMPILCPLFIAFPSSAYSLWNQKRLQDLNDALCKAHAALEAAHGRLREKSRRDPMTGFLNRDAFFSAVESSRRRTDRGAFLLIDADHFKRINDNYGHLVGDDALVEIADAIRRSVRERDMVGRIGGEEFGAMLAGASTEEAAAIAERIRRAVEEVCFMPGQGQTMKLTVSIGATTCWPDALITDLMRKADRQLYRAKREGRNRTLMDTGKPLAA